MSKLQPKSQSLPVINPNAAGIDIGGRFHVVAVPPECCDEPVQTFKAFTGDIHNMAHWLAKCGITTIAMESTGVYWVPVYEILEEHGFEVVLSNARDTRAVPGRKTDVGDAQWIQRLHACGLLKASFRPEAIIAELRAYMRVRERLLDYAAAHIQHMQKALTYMNIQLSIVVSDISGVTGMKIVRAIVAGEKNPNVLAKLRDPRCKADEQTISAALNGNYQPEHLFALRQAVLMYDAYQLRVDECDVQIESVLNRLCMDSSEPKEPIPKPKNRTKQPNAMTFDVREKLYRLIGIDLTQIHGIGSFLALRLISECGTDMNKWPTEKHFTSWLTLCPGSKISGGKVMSSHSRKSNNRVVAHLRLAATTVGRSDTALGAFYRRLSSRVGKAKAVTATARKIAILFYNAMKYGTK
ncbi:IS110 family transposase [Providencia sp. AGC89]|uniref:IS110 family transposase n=1 Tax=Providencia rettgeri TaxID=587 RepID=UPI002480D503|nr:IS110 family transposase [Providencia rettgeri]MDU7495916.1 IS110 family transposase [Providencia rettgeri]